MQSPVEELLACSYTATGSPKIDKTLRAEVYGNRTNRQYESVIYWRIQGKKHRSVNLDRFSKTTAEAVYQPD